MNAACVQLGFCLPPTVKEVLKERSDLSSKEFVRVVIAAEGFEPIHLESSKHLEPLMRLYRQHVSNT